MDDPVTSHIDVATKSTYPMMISLSHDLNFTYEKQWIFEHIRIKIKIQSIYIGRKNCRCNVLQVDSYGWLVNGTWDGIMGLYAKNKVDLTLHGTSMRVDRMKYVEFTTDLAELW